MELNEKDLKTITEVLIKASNLTETEWLNMEKIMLETISSGQSEITSSNILEMWNQLYLKINNSINRMKRV